MIGMNFRLGGGHSYFLYRVIFDGHHMSMQEVVIDGDLFEEIYAAHAV